MTHSVPTAFRMNAVGMEWVTPAFMMNAVGMEWVTPGLPRMTILMLPEFGPESGALATVGEFVLNVTVTSFTF